MYLSSKVNRSTWPLVLWPLRNSQRCQTHGAKLWNRHVKIMVHYGTLWYTMVHVYKTHERREIQINISSNT